ncbi:MAG TPA: hypothetical protein ENH86_01530 [Candidatus Jorgensenbacteria bacterium]|nr:hypothetical protein [Candidatus Jorgensenbacteria bacterium]
MKKLIFLFFLFILLVPLTVVWAQEPVVFELPEAGSTNIVEYINSFYMSAVAIAGLAAVVMIVIGAIYYVVSGGSQDKQREGKDIITSAVWGLVLLLGAYTILNTINPELVDLSPPGGEGITIYSCGEKNPVKNECGEGKRPIKDPDDPEATPQCCVPGLGYGLTAGCPKDIMSDCASPVTWSSDMKIPKCYRSEISSPCPTQWGDWNTAVKPTVGAGIYYQWVYYPKNTVPGATSTPQIEELKCIVYAYKISVEDEKFKKPGLQGLKKCL